MEIITSFSNHEDIADAIKGSYGKEIGKDYKLVYIGNVIIGMADNTTILDKNCKQKHYEWIEIGEKLFLAFCK